jgi:DNA-binding Lrp family transcriptional regulator
VAARIRSMAERHVLGIAAVLDWQAAGYDWDLWIEVELEAGGPSLVAVRDELTTIAGIQSVTTILGPVDLLIHGLVSDRAEAQALINDRITTVGGVRRVQPNVVLDTVKYSAQYAQLPGGPHRGLRLPAPTVDLDGLDREIVLALVEDGRQSNRSIGRALQTSESTVRARLRRLEEAGLLRIVGQSDPFQAGLVRAAAFIWIDVDAGAVDRAARTLAAMSELTLVAVIAGRHDLLIGAVTATHDELVQLVTERLRAVPGVRSTETWEVTHIMNVGRPWVRFGPTTTDR